MSFSTSSAGGFLKRDSDGVPTMITGAVTTTDGTVTVILTIPIPRSSTVGIITRIVGVKSDNTEAAQEWISGTFVNNAGTVTQTGSSNVITPHETDAAWGADHNVSGETAQVRVQGAAGDTVRWFAVCEMIRVSN